ncbi:MAG: T9SS type A sorting domain-containing protein [Bacteroidetes bacterium]|nr:T9SS type A sorting domain-containing protein [Bacteroidota bacterium]
MYKLLLTLALFASGPMYLAAQTDTAWVETLNFSDITKRKGTYTFPDSGSTWQQIRMHYTLKCDAQTTQDGYPCGEWDYLSYIIVHDSTGVMDSTRYDQANFLIGDAEYDSFQWVSTPLFDTTYSWQYRRVVDQINSRDSAEIGMNIAKSTDAFHKRRMQFIYTANELIAKGFTAGNITSMAFDFSQASGTINQCMIRLAPAPGVPTTQVVTGPFTTVFNGDFNPTTTGWNEIQFLAPFVWDGTSDVVVDISHNDDTPSGIFELMGEANLSGLQLPDNDLVYTLTDNSFLELQNTSSILSDLSSEITVAFWSKGDEVLPVNTSILEAKDANGNRVLNIHMPWGNGSIYWDAGNSGPSYDRINKVASDNEIKNRWNFWSFTKNATTGEMKIYLNGSLWLSGTAKDKSMTGIESLRIGKGITSNQFRGKLDHFTVWKKELTQSDIQALMVAAPTSTHPNFSDLLIQLEFDSYSMTTPYKLASAHDTTVWCAANGMTDIRQIAGSEAFHNAVKSNFRPQVRFYQTDQTSHLDSSERWSLLARPYTILTLFEDPTDVTKVSGYTGGYASGMVYSYNPDGSLRDSSMVSPTSSIVKSTRPWYVPFEVVNNVEIGRYITPYGINFDLGPDGFKWIYDVTDYAELLNGRVTLSAGNQQELIDLRFEFIPGTPAREVKRINYYINRESRQYRVMADNSVFQEQTFTFGSETKTAKLITRITGHGHNTDPDKDHCCEWANKTHYLKVNGKNDFEWDIWQNDKCALNPLIDQGGNWSPPRAGWCPGAPVDDYMFDFTPYVSQGAVSIDYEIEPVPTDNLGQGGGNYVVSMHLIEYGDWNHQNDASVTRIIKPTDWEFYRRMNPTCTSPRIAIRNTGGATAKSILLRYGVESGNPILFEWKGELLPDQETEVDLPFSVWDYLSETNSMTFYAEVVKVNGVNDEYVGNNRAASSFTIPDVVPNTVEVWFRNNSIPDATIRIADASDQTVYEVLDGAAGQLIRKTLELNPGCYKLVCETENGFGLYYPLIPQVGSGLLRLSATGFVKTFNPDFGKTTEYHFTVAYPLSTPTESDIRWTVYPNPGNGIATIEALGRIGERYAVSVQSVDGALIHESNHLFENGLIEVDLSDQPGGVYIIRFESGDHRETFKYIKY